MRFNSYLTLLYIDPNNFLEVYNSLESSTIIAIRDEWNTPKNPDRVQVIGRRAIYNTSEDLINYLVTNDERRKIRRLIKSKSSS